MKKLIEADYGRLNSKKESTMLTSTIYQDYRAKRPRRLKLIYIMHIRSQN